jgi:hypothetical protein
MGNLFGKKSGKPSFLKGFIMSKAGEIANQNGLSSMKHTGIDPYKKPVTGSTGTRLGDGYVDGRRDDSPPSSPGGRGRKKPLGPVKTPLSS